MTASSQYNGRTADELATDAELAVQGIAHLAEAYDTPLAPETIYRALGGLTRMLGIVPEAVTRLNAAAVRQHELDALRIDSGPFRGNPAAAVGALQDAVDEMLAAFGAVRTNLDNAQATLAGARSSS